ncbi:uncharacterized protein F4812DRAFT_463015 [Daldinia caldariorum]|uniref:uncharacterized protein n=1 Tax=Daldinia caldariorum TaxID=326644 RepID=UPI002007C9D3|nr:uncharacterized protein F4812DRAFT_463015 [Daldinia caldariorum]KAI1464264.1 hypothetical protein F4812DRAFT_463015 [Daldinia caldariorum]
MKELKSNFSEIKEGKYPNSSGSRRLPDNLSDLKAQVAANNKGSNLIKALMEECGKHTVHFYKSKIQENVEVSVRNYLKFAYKRYRHDILLNQGCFTPTKVILPKNCFLNPSSGPAVCCGNTLTSQRLVDPLPNTFRAASGSQGCMNYFGFFGNCRDDPGKPQSEFVFSCRKLSHICSSLRGFILNFE